MDNSEILLKIILLLFHVVLQILQTIYIIQGIKILFIKLLFQILLFL